MLILSYASPSTVLWTVDLSRFNSFLLPQASGPRFLSSTPFRDIECCWPHMGSTQRGNGRLGDVSVGTTPAILPFDLSARLE